MKPILVILLICFALSNGKIIQTTFQSIEDFKAQHPNVELTEMRLDINENKDSRSYSLGARQTGKINYYSIHFRKYMLLVICYCR
jgi:hypothetical protein